MEVAYTHNRRVCPVSIFMVSSGFPDLGNLLLFLLSQWKVFYVLKVLRHGFVSLLHIMFCKYSGLMQVPTVRNIYISLNPSGQDGQLSWTTRRLYLCICNSVFARTGGGQTGCTCVFEKVYLPGQAVDTSQDIYDGQKGGSAEKKLEDGGKNVLIQMRAI